MPALREHPHRGLHLGWIPNDPGLRLREFAERAPQSPGPDAGKARALHAARAFRSGWIRLLIAVGAFALALFGLVGSVSRLGWFWDIAVAVAAGCWLPAVCLAWTHRRAVRGQRRDDEERARRHAADVAEYEERKARWDKSEVERVARAPRWLRVGAHEDISRLDVFGGTPEGRRNMLTGLGWSLLQQRAVIVLDLSQDRVCAGLIPAVGQAGIPYQDYQLPRDLRATPLLAGLSGDQIASQIVEVMHADDPHATTAGRATDLMVLGKIQRVLGGDVSMARLHEALCFLLADAQAAPDGGCLTSQQRAGLGGLFSGFRQEITGNLVRLAAVVEPLRELGTDAGPRPPARLTCLSLEDGPRDVAADLTAALIVQWATQSIVSGGEDGGFRPAIVLAGADEQATRHLGRLTTVCERYQVPLVRTFSRLTEESARHLDSRNTAFMRLPTRSEALRAAEHIGLERRFVAGHFSHSHSVSRSRTRTVSESVTHTTGSTEGGSVTKTTGTTTGESFSETEIPRRDHHAPGDRQASGKGEPGKGDSGKGESGKAEPGRGQAGKREAGENPRAASGPVVKDIIKTRTRFTAQHASQAKTQSWSTSEETSHTRSESLSRTDGTSVGDEITYDLAYDHKVQPETLMELPEDRMLAPHIVEGSPGHGIGPADSRMVALVIDPAVIGSDQVAPVGPDEIPAYEAPPPLVSSHVPDYARVPAP